jgi:transposase-like protein
LQHVRYPLSHSTIEDFLPERGIEISYEIVRVCWNRFWPMLAVEINRRRVNQMRTLPR